MSAADLSRALQAFDDQALATLANVGLVRRAQRDLASGKIALEAVEDGTARLLVDGQIVALGAAGPAAASCDCPAMGVCRHRIAAVLFLRDLDGTADAADTQADAPPGDPQDIVSAISLEDARKFAGRPGWRAALELLVEVTGVEVAETSIGVTFAGLDEAVLILRGQGIAGVVSKAAKAKKKPYHAAALIAARRHFGLPEDGLEADDPVAVEPQGPVPPDPQLRAELGLDDAEVTGFIGSFYDYEGLDDLIAAMPELVAQRPKAKLLLVGGGPREQALRAQAQASPVAQSIRFVGRVPHDQVERYYSLIDILAYPRKSMRLTDLVTPLKPLEAMAQGRLVAASSVGGHRELIEDGVTGTLFAPDDPNAIAVALSQLLVDRTIWDLRRKTAREFVERERNWASNIVRYQPVYQNLLEQRGR